MHQYMKKVRYLFVIKAILLTACTPSGEQPGPDPAPTPGSSRLAVLLGAGENEGFPRVAKSREFRFPADHGPHETYRNEWWYFTGNLDADEGRRFGFELTIFRFALTPAMPADTGSAWRANQVYIGHLAVTDVRNDRFHVAERYSRGAAGLAGATVSPVRVWLDDWDVSADAEGRWQLRAREGGIALELSLDPLKPAVLNGDRGLSQKSAEPGNASWYYSVPRLATRGQLLLDGRRFAVDGLSWLDREWGSSALAAYQQGWDWFALQLSDGSDLMVYTLRGPDGLPDPHSSGTRVDADGAYRALDADDVSIAVTGHWESARGGRYPAGWEILIPKEQLSLSVTPVVDDQELVTNVRYWEGAVDVTGTVAGRVIDGRGYVELTGYAGN